MPKRNTRSGAKQICPQATRDRLEKDAIVTRISATGPAERQALSVTRTTVVLRDIPDRALAILGADRADRVAGDDRSLAQLDGRPLGLLSNRSSSTAASNPASRMRLRRRLAPLRKAAERKCERAMQSLDASMRRFRMGVPACNSSFGTSFSKTAPGSRITPGQRVRLRGFKLTCVSDRRRLTPPPRFCPGCWSAGHADNQLPFVHVQPLGRLPACRGAAP